ncbi:AtpZ/AtpI family protein [Pedobacter cryophilus]|uniref:AtpZ/AtpI family protein n=1 Tax=Pedobacter cryophilus TaxID=2571271 RepID=A0A4U1C4E3_9SPHI|nr:AtpZ/AtpI family protein [Pedobacter cryophilus]TKC00229.1 AtpZ/AtpI family protein [Pedobacter cryophilus]
MEEKKLPQKEKPALNSYIKYSGLGFQMIGVIGAFTFAGYKLDESQQTKTPIYTGILSLIGVLASLYIVLKGLKSN